MTVASDWYCRARAFLLAAMGIDTGTEMQRPIGEGGAGRTYLGQSRLTLIVQQKKPDERAFQQLVHRENWPARTCCKFIPPDSKLLADERDGIHRIATFQQCDPHPHLLKLFGYTEFEGGFIEVMELADEVSRHTFQTLEQHIWAQGRLSLGDAYTITRCLAEAAQHLRNHHRRHQDIKPANVVCVGGAWKLADFGAVIIESKSGVEGRLTQEPYGPDTAGLARTMYAMLSGKYLRQPYDPLPKDLLPLGDVLHVALILPSARESEAINTPAEFLRQLDKIFAAGSSKPELPPAEHIRKLADAMAAHVSSHNRGVLTTLGGTAIVCSAVAAAASVAALWWLPEVVLVPPLLAAGIVLGAVTLYRRAGGFWTLRGLAQWLDDRAGTPNLVLSALDYACGAESGLARAESKVWVAWSCLDAAVPFQYWLNDVSNRCKIHCWSLTPRWLRPRSVDRRVAIWSETRSRSASVGRLIAPRSEFAVAIVRRAERQFLTLMHDLPPEDVFLAWLKRWGNRLLGLAAGLLLLAVLWFAFTIRQPGLGNSSGVNEPQPPPNQPSPQTTATQPNPGGGDDSDSHDQKLDQEQLAESVKLAKDALVKLARPDVQQLLTDAEGIDQTLPGVEEFNKQAEKALNSADNPGAGDGGSSSSATGVTAAASGTSPGQDAAGAAASGSQQGNTAQQSAGNADSSSASSGQMPPPSSGIGPSSSSPQQATPSGSSGSQGQGVSPAGTSPADMKVLAQQAAAALEQAKQSLDQATPSLQGSPGAAKDAAAAAAACNAAVQSLRSLATTGQGGVAANSDSPGGESTPGINGGGKGGREPGRGSTPDGHSGGHAAPLVLNGRVISVPLSVIRGGDQSMGTAAPMKVNPSSLQRRSEGESADAMIVDEHKKRALNSILTPPEAAPNGVP